MKACISQKNIRGISWHEQFTKRHNSVKSVGCVVVLVLCISSDNTLYLYQVSMKCLLWFMINRTDMIFKLKIIKGHNYLRANVSAVMVLNLCTSSDDAVYLYRNSRYFLRGFRGRLVDMKNLQRPNSVKM